MATANEGRWGSRVQRRRPRGARGGDDGGGARQRWRSGREVRYGSGRHARRWRWRRPSAVSTHSLVPGGGLGSATAAAAAESADERGAAGGDAGPAAEPQRQALGDSEPARRRGEGPANK